MERILLKHEFTCEECLERTVDPRCHDTCEKYNEDKGVFEEIKQHVYGKKANPYSPFYGERVGAKYY